MISVFGVFAAKFDSFSGISAVKSSLKGHPQVQRADTLIMAAIFLFDVLYHPESGFTNT